MSVSVSDVCHQISSPSSRSFLLQILKSIAADFSFSSPANVGKQLFKVLKDQIRELPDDVLSFTLSFLPIREASRTSILSRRWRYLGKDSVKFSTTLALDDSGMSGSTYADRFSVYTKDGSFADETRRFIEWVDRILQLGYGPVIDLFRLRFEMGKESAVLVDKWINVAITKRARRYDIDLSGFHDWQFDWPDDNLYTFPVWLFTQGSGPSLNCLHLNCCILGPLDLKCFSSLADLQLHSVLFDRDSFAKFLPNCFNLEKLSLINCWKLRRLSISGPSLKLKKLKVVRCRELRHIKINARNLERFQYYGAKVQISFVDVRGLSNFINCTDSNDASAMRYAFRKLSSDLPQLEMLLIGGKPLERKKIPRCLPMFANLKKLVVRMMSEGENLWGFIRLLHAAPFLQTLEFHLSCRKYNEEKGPGDVPHLQLKEMMVSGFRAESHELELIRYLLANCLALQKVTLLEGQVDYDPLQEKLVPVIPKKLPDYLIEKYKLNVKKKSVQEQAKEQLMPVKPWGVLLLFE